MTDPEWETKIEQRITTGPHTGKTMLSPERRILLLDQLVDEILAQLEEFRPPDGVPWLFPGRRSEPTRSVAAPAPSSKLRKGVAERPHLARCCFARGARW